MGIRSYKDLTVWQEGVRFVLDLYRVTEKFPQGERFGLLAQLRRAAVSIPSNIAEGHIQNSDAVFARHLEIALGSAAEVDTQLLIAQQLNYISKEEFDQLRNTLESIMKMLHRFLKTVRNKPPANR
jgi:four helix bundle protein